MMKRHSTLDSLALFSQFLKGMKLTELNWTSHFAENLPGDPERGNFVRQVRHSAYSEVRPSPVREARLLGWSDDLASELDLERPLPGSPDVEVLAGNLVLPVMRPYSARYGGHQFGHWAQQLGDGRAITLGEAG